MNTTPHTFTLNSSFNNPNTDQTDKVVCIVSHHVALELSFYHEDSVGTPNPALYPLTINLQPHVFKDFLDLTLLNARQQLLLVYTLFFTAHFLCTAFFAKTFFCLPTTYNPRTILKVLYSLGPEHKSACPHRRPPLLIHIPLFLNAT